MDSNGNIFGATYSNGEYDSTVFELSPDGKGGWNPTVIYDFTVAEYGYFEATGTPVFDNAGNIYGTLNGAVYKLSPGEGGWTGQILYSGGYTYQAGVVLDAAGNLY